MIINVLEIRLLNDEKPLKAFADAQVGTWIVRDWRIIQQNGKRAYVMAPQLSWKDPATSEIKYKTILTIPAEEKQQIDVAILSAFHREKEKFHESPCG